MNEADASEGDRVHRCGDLSPVGVVACGDVRVHQQLGGRHGWARHGHGRAEHKTHTLTSPDADCPPASTTANVNGIGGGRQGLRDRLGRGLRAPLSPPPPTGFTHLALPAPVRVITKAARAAVIAEGAEVRGVRREGKLHPSASSAPSLRTLRSGLSALARRQIEMCECRNPPRSEKEPQARRVDHPPRTRQSDPRGLGGGFPSPPRALRYARRAVSRSRVQRERNFTPPPAP